MSGAREAPRRGAPTRLFAVRLAATGAASRAALALLDPALPPVIAGPPVGLIASRRGAFAPARALAGPVVLAAMVWAVALVREWLRPMPWVCVAAMGLSHFAGFHMILRTGARAGMPLIVVTVPMSVMGMGSTASLIAMRDAFTQAAAAPSC